MQPPTLSFLAKLCSVCSTLPAPTLPNGLLSNRYPACHWYSAAYACRSSVNHACWLRVQSTAYLDSKVGPCALKFQGVAKNHSIESHLLHVHNKMNGDEDYAAGAARSSKGLFTNTMVFVLFYQHPQVAVHACCGFDLKLTICVCSQLPHAADLLLTLYYLVVNALL